MRLSAKRNRINKRNRKRRRKIKRLNHRARNRNVWRGGVWR